MTRKHSGMILLALFIGFALGFCISRLIYAPL